MRIPARLPPAASTVPGIRRHFLRFSNLIGSSHVVRGLAALAVSAALVAGGSAAPLTARAEDAPVAVTAPATVESTATVTTTTTATVESTTTTPTLAAPPVVRKLSIPQLIAKLGHEAGLSNTEVDALLWIAKHESNFHPTSHSRSECHGLFQLSAAMAHGRPWKDPTWNTKRGIRYMKGRYGGVLQAKSFWLKHHWY
jgi:soluble lytic murein transglycosylase-like protein